MANKIDVMNAMGAGHRFARANFWSFVKLAWLPFGLGLVGRVLGEMVTPETASLLGFPQTFQDRQSIARLSVLFNLGSFVLFVPHWVLWMRVAAGQADVPQANFYFRWSRVEWLTLLAGIVRGVWFSLAAVAGFAPLIASIVMRDGDGALVSLFARGNAGAAAPDITIDAVTLLLGLGGVLALIWVFSRLLLVQVIPALEGRFAPFYAVNLMTGQFGRVLYCGALVLLCFLGLVLPLYVAVFAVGEVLAAIVEGSSLAVLLSLAVYGFALGLLGFVFSLFTSGLTAQFWVQLTRPAADIPSQSVAG